jgi:metal-dependent amidase/aminoacylase/carboxypeptidase family protein
LHNLPGYSKHHVVLRDSVFAVASKGLILKLKGETSHAAHPRDGRSPALAMAQIIETFSSIPQYYTSLHEAAKVTLIHARLGEKAFGTSPGFAEIAATLRTYYDRDMVRLEEKALELASHIAQTYDLTFEHEWTEPFKATINDPDSNKMLDEIVNTHGYEISRRETPFAWSEDFGQFLDQYKGALFGLGAGVQHPQLHASNYDFPDEIIHTGLVLFLGLIDKITSITEENSEGESN